jgi:retron-type reverse transcriptase
MLDAGRKLFAKIHRQKRQAHHNHEIHFMSREIEDWLPAGIQSMTDGNYAPRCLRRYYFKDEVIDQLHLSDRIFQNLLLKQLKPTFPYVMNPNCYHLHGPSGVKLATQRIRQVLQEDKPSYIIRADIKSFYKSIPHHKLIQDIKHVYDDPKVQSMLEEIINNPIETPRGYKNPGHGIALRGPLSQFFSAIYLKPLDDAFNKMDVTYLRYQDDIIILCKTKRQLNRCRRRMMEVLHERRLTLSRKKTRIGCIQSGFHFLGIHYPGTQTLDNINMAHFFNDSTMINEIVYSLISTGGVSQLLSINRMNRSALCLIRGRCEKQGSK